MKDIRQEWKAHAADRKITKEDIAALCIYRALVKEQGKEGVISKLQKSFKPITNSVKIENGAHPYGSLDAALCMVKHSTFVSWLDETDRLSVIAMAKEIKIQRTEIL